MSDGGDWGTGWGMVLTHIRWRSVERTRKDIVVLRAHIIAGLDEFDAGKRESAVRHLRAATNDADFVRLGIRQDEVLNRLREYDRKQRRP